MVFNVPFCLGKGFADRIINHVSANFDFISTYVNRSNNTSKFRLKTPTVFIDMHYPLIKLETISRFIKSFDPSYNRPLVSAIELYPNFVLGRIPLKEIFAGEVQVKDNKAEVKTASLKLQGWECICLHLSGNDNSGVIMCKVDEIQDKWREYDYHPNGNVFHKIKAKIDSVNNLLSLKFKQIEDCKISMRILKECKSAEQELSIFTQMERLFYYDYAGGVNIDYRTGKKIIGRQQHPLFFKIDGPITLVPQNYNKKNFSDYDYISVTGQDAFFVNSNESSIVAESLWDKFKSVPCCSQGQSRIYPFSK